MRDQRLQWQAAAIHVLDGPAIIIALIRGKHRGRQMHGDDLHIEIFTGGISASQYQGAAISPSQYRSLKVHPEGLSTLNSLVRRRK